ncbi:MAG: outer membrane lipoprotein carrier protein LolA [Bacilli bacterium]|nr:outer membrane lipoprotein carrier protein LolA [Bacilli bacterium]
MRKYFLLLILTVGFLTGCKANNEINVIDKFSNEIKRSKSYHLLGTMEIQNDEIIYEYDMNVYHLNDNYYKVEMTNKSNNQKQVILRNDEGLYVITPALNKSYKFESNWPDNSSQAYILSSLLRDINNDKNVKVDQKGKEYIIISTVNYPNNSDLKYQKVYLDDNYMIKKVEVYSSNDIIKIVVNFTDVDLKAGLKEKDFELSEFIEEKPCEDDNCNEKKSMNTIETAIYPLYMPANTYLNSSEMVNSELDSRIILTFSGDKNFVLVEESSKINNELEIIPVYGEPIMLNDTIGAISNNSMYWTSNDVDYYLVSNDLTESEMAMVATSLSNAKSTLAEK